VSAVEGEPQLLYLEPDDEITSVIRRLRGADLGRVVLVAPGRSRATSSVVALRLLARAAAETGRSVALVADAPTRALAGEAGVAAFASVADATSATPSAAEPILPTRAPIHVVRGTGPARPAPVKPPPPTDGLDETVAVHLPPPVTGSARSARRGGPPRMPRWPWLVFPLTVLIVAGAALLPGATIHITPKAVAVGPISVPVTLDVGGHQTGNLESTKQGTATGERVEKVPATGVVTFFNWNTVAVEVPQGTHVSVGGTTAFVTMQRIVVSRGRFGGPPGSKKVDVAAVEGGTAGNVAAGAIDTIDDAGVRAFLRGFPDNPNRLVQNDQPTSGGAETSHTVIEQKDVDAAVAAIEADLRQQLDAALAGQPDRIYVGPSESEVPTVDVPADLVGTEDTATFELRGTLTFDRAYGSRTQAEDAARSAFAAMTGVAPSGTVIVGSTIAVQLSSARLNGGRLEVSAIVTAQAAAQIDEVHVRDQVAGMTVAEAKAALASLGAIRVDLWPGWVDRIPRLTFRIEIRPEFRTPGESAAPSPSGTAGP
jgi:baseplate J-like protein